jgi:hypothetical protein
MQTPMTNNKCLSPLIRLIILKMMIVVALCADSAVKEFEKCDDWDCVIKAEFENGGESLVVTSPRWEGRVCRIDGRPLDGYSLDLTCTAKDSRSGCRIVLQLPVIHSVYWSNRIQNCYSFARGDRVQVHYKGKGRWHPGRFYAMSNGLYSITFDNTRAGDRRFDIEKKHILPLGPELPLIGAQKVRAIGLSTDHFAQYKAIHDVLAKEHVFVVKEWDTENNCPGVKSLLCLHEGEWSEYYATPQADGQLVLTLKPLTVDRMTDNAIVFRQTRIDTVSQVNAITAKLRTNFKRRQAHGLGTTVVNRNAMFGSVWEAFRRALRNDSVSPKSEADYLNY